MPAVPGPRIVAVLGSATPPGRLRRAVSDALERAAGRHRSAVELIDLAERQIAAADGRPLEVLGDDTEATVAAIAGADAVLLATPVYRGSMTGTLKNLLDHVPVEALHGTPVAIVAMGASDHHYLGADRHLRDVLTFFGALTIPNSAYLSSGDFEDGVPTPGAAAELDAALDAVVALSRAGLGPIGPRPLQARRD